MPKFKIIIGLFLLLSFISISKEACYKNENNCEKCHPNNNICLKCQKNIYKPDDKGGCIDSKKCLLGANYCYECNKDENLCSKCEEGYFHDENGGCSYSNHCEISYQGKCLRCLSDYTLIGQNDNLKLCKYLYSDDLKNCKSINLSNGLCDVCEKGFYKNEKDNKCIKTENCAESLFGICSKCKENFILNKKENKCQKKNKNFKHCQLTVDGITCDICDENFYLAEDGKCVQSNFCSKSDDEEEPNCIECIENYYLSTENKICTKEKKCEKGDKDSGVCISCILGYYLNTNDWKCLSNQEDNEFKFCKRASATSCSFCENGYHLGLDHKCSSTEACQESSNGICTSCQKNYYFDLKKQCTSIKHCIDALYTYWCYECEENYFFNKFNKTCDSVSGNIKFEHCKSSTTEKKICGECKNNFYLNKTDYLCYSNSDKNNLFYKCKFSDDSGSKCSECETNYFLGGKDNKCSKIEGCLVSENENKCIECDDGYCFDVKKGTCEYNFILEEIENKIYFNCNRTNDDGTKCAICLEGFVLDERGICVNMDDCETIIDGKCIECKDINKYGNYVCLNKDFGCSETIVDNCLKCDDNNLILEKCTECKEGYKLDDNYECEKK